MSSPWFGAKRYGIGLSPKSPAGWFALGACVAAILAVPPVSRRLEAPGWAAAAASILLTLAFLLLAWLKSDRSPWSWRWGGR